MCSVSLKLKFWIWSRSPGIIIFLVAWGLPGVRPLSWAALGPGFGLCLGLSLSGSLSLSGGLGPILALSRSLSRGLDLVLFLSAAAAEEADLVVILCLQGIGAPGPGPELKRLSWTALVIRSLLFFITCCSFCCHFLLADCRARRRSCSSDSSSSSTFTNGCSQNTHTHTQFQYKLYSELSLLSKSTNTTM